MTHLKTMRVQFADAQTSSGTRGGTREFVPSEVTNSTFTLEGQVHYEKEFGQVFFFSWGQTSQACASQGPLTFQTHHTKHAKAANSNQMEHLEIIKV